MDIKDRRLGIFGAFILLGLVAVALLNLYQAKTIDAVDKPIAYSSFLDDVEKHRVCAVAISGPDISGLFCDNHPFRTVAASDPDLVRVLRANHVGITALPPPDAGPSWNGALTTLVPVLLLIGIAGFFLWRRPGLGTQGANLVKAPAKLLAQTGPSVTFADVAGVDEATESLQEIVDFLRSPQKFRHLGGRIPRGVLLVGPPGTGKTLLARAIAGEASVPFFSISGSSFVEMFVGIGAARVRALFEQAKKSAPCIIFMDEIDAVGRKRGAGLGGGNDEREQTLNQLLVEMDGFETNEGTILIAATNRPDILDPALLRPGRFDREIVVGKPDIKGRQQILAIHTRTMPLDPGVDLHRIARYTPGFSGADLANLVNEAALLAARRGKSNVGQREFDDARDTITMGPERRTHVMTEKQRRLIAYREGGRAIVSLNLPLSEPLHKVTIMTRGRSGGMVRHQSEEEQDTMTQEQMLSRLTFLMAGRAAEEMTFGRPKVTAASASDIDKATKLARTMVTKWGLSDALGAVTYDDNQDEVFLGHAIARQQNVSDETAQKITAEVRNLLDVALGEARRILEAHRNELEALAKNLLEFETLGGEEISGLLAGKMPARAGSQ